MLNTLRFAFRSLGKTPGFILVALGTLALGIGVETSMFSTFQALLFQSGPFPQPEQLVQILGATPRGPIRDFSQMEVEEIRAQTSSFTALATISRTFFALSEPGRPAERVSGIAASKEFWDTFAVPPEIGRAFTPEETEPGRNNVVLLSHAYWQQRYGGNRDVLGQTMRLDGQTVTIIGVMPERFDYRMLWGNTQVWRPLNFTKDQLAYRDYRSFSLIGRTKADRRAEQISAELAPLAESQRQAHPEVYSSFRYRVLPLHAALMDELGHRISWMMLGLSGFVLLIACTNLANLQLARATGRSREWAIRAALGASRARLVGEQLLECVLVGLGGGALGVLVAVAINRALERSVEIDGLAGLAIPIDRTVLLSTLMVSVATGALFGLVPALLVSQTDVNTALKQQGRGTSGGRGHHRLRKVLIVAEVALALTLLGGAAILERGFAHFLDRETGWDTARVLTATLPVPETRIDSDAKRVELFRKIERRITALPGVEHAALATSLPLFSYSGDRQILKEGQSPGSNAQLPSAYHVMVTSGYFATLGIPLREGRSFSADTKADDPRVIMVNESLARQLWPDESPIGKRLGSMDSGKAYWAEIIGVVRDVESAGSVAPPPTPFVVYKPLVQEPWSWVYLILRSPAPAALTEPLRRAVAEIDPDLPADQVGTVQQAIDRAQHNLVLTSRTLTAFALLGLLLAAVGIYGVISNVVEQRRTEFGIRMALGAQARDVQALVLRQGLALTSLGLALGLIGAYELAHLLYALLPRIATPDPMVFAAAALTIFVVALFACFIPAHRATKVDPLQAVREE